MSDTSLRCGDEQASQSIPRRGLFTAIAINAAKDHAYGILSKHNDTIVNETLAYVQIKLSLDLSQLM